jgi:hypothetical protein
MYSFSPPAKLTPSGAISVKQIQKCALKYKDHADSLISTFWGSFRLES